jgi:pyruvate-ferredoxin/flavodoxin oxidoreductase
MALAHKKKRQEVFELVHDLLAENNLKQKLRSSLENWVANFQNSKQTRDAADALTQQLNLVAKQFEQAKKLLELKDYFIKISQWLIGGDGWAYDIGYGGIDHVIASGADVNILVLDNAVYSTTGGQKSKATPRAAVASFATSGKYQSKKDLGMLAMTYGNVYVAQIASGANAAQSLKAFKEAESFPGPSLIIAYTPCINHGLKGGMSRVLEEAKEAVSSGYWSLYRYHPGLAEKGKNPMTLDFLKPNFTKMQDFMNKQLRFSSLTEHCPEKSEELFAKTVGDAKRRFASYARMSGDFEKLRKEILD